MIKKDKYYFLSRPRRFGKSLLLDTIAEVFHGDRELFKGLWIDGSDYDFPVHPVIRLDMSSTSNETPETLKHTLTNALLRQAEDEGFSFERDLPSEIFLMLIIGLYKKYNQRVVVLIDEYDKPVLDHILDKELAEANQKVLKDFYGILKSMDPYLRFIFITGVSKHAKMGIFSDLNNLTDITMAGDYANICGIPVEDLDQGHADRTMGRGRKVVRAAFAFLGRDEIVMKVLR